MPDQTRIYGGQEAAQHNYNWMVVIVVVKNNGNKILCGGSILSKTKVLTAAHCTTNAKQMRIYYGVHSLNQAQMRVNMKSFVRHEKYDFPNYDIAIITVEEPFEFNAKVGHVCLPTSKNLQLEQSSLLIGLGWGRTETSRFSNVLKENVFTVISDEDCQRVYGSFLNEKIVVCTQDSPGQSVCQGDSGSALGRLENGRFVQYAIISFTSRKCDRGHPTGYTELSPMLDWIKDNL